MSTQERIQLIKELTIIMRDHNTSVALRCLCEEKLIKLIKAI